MDPLLFGHSADERIVAAGYLNDQTIRLYSRESQAVSFRDAAFFPFFYLSDPEFLDGFSTPHWLKELTGTNPFRYIAAFSKWSDMWDAVHHVLRSYNASQQPRAPSFHELPVLSLRSDPIRQFLLQSGITLFKGCAFDDVVRMQVEAIIRPRPTARHGEPLIVALAARASCEAEVFLSTLGYSEQEILTQFVSWVAQVDPDVIEGHHLRDRVLPLILDRCEHFEISPAFGRNGKVLHQHTTGTPSTSFDAEHTTFECFGRHIVDTVHLLEWHLVGRFATERTNLGALEGLLGINEPTPPPSPAEMLAAWERDQDEGSRGLLRRLRSIQHITQKLLPPYLEQTKMCPMPLDALVLATPSVRAESIVLRSYIREKHSVPQIPSVGTTTNVFAEGFRSGLYTRILALNVRPFSGVHLVDETLTLGSDQLRAIPRIAVALDALAASSEPTGEAASSLIAGLSAHRLSSRGLFCDPAHAQDIVERMGNEVRSIANSCDVQNALPIHGDAELLFISLPDNIVGESNESAFLERVRPRQTHRLQVIGRFVAMLAHRRRSFALLTETNDVLIAGTSLVPKSGERFIRKFLSRCVECFLTNDFSRLHHTYASFHTMITKHQWNAADFCRVETAHEEMDVYAREVEAGTRTPSPAMESARRARMYVRPGTRIGYYVGGVSGESRLAQSCKIMDEWDPNLPNENTAYYLQRLQDACSRFKDFVHPKDFELIFSLDDLFGFSAEGIEVVRRDISSDHTEGPSAGDREDEFGIWLAEEDSP